MQNSVAVLCDNKEFLLFNAIKHDVFYIEKEEEIINTFKALSIRYQMIIINDALAEKMEDTIKKYDELVYPIILVLPSAKSQKNYALKRIAKNAKESLGVELIKE